METKSGFYISQKIKEILSKNPGLSIKEIANMLDVNRQFMAGYLASMEENGEVYSRKIGPAKIYFNAVVKANE